MIVVLSKCVFYIVAKLLPNTSIVTGSNSVRISSTNPPQIRAQKMDLILTSCTFSSAPSECRGSPGSHPASAAPPAAPPGARTQSAGKHRQEPRVPRG